MVDSVLLRGWGSGGLKFGSGCCRVGEDRSTPDLGGNEGKGCWPAGLDGGLAG